MKINSKILILIFNFSLLTFFIPLTFNFSLLTFNLNEATAAVLSKAPNNLGLVGYWTFNEGTSTVALDYSGNKNKGTLVNGPTWVNGKQGKALNFDGGNDYVEVSDTPTLRFTTSFSVSSRIYFKATDGVNDDVIVTKTLHASSQTGYYLIQNVGATTVSVGFYDGVGYRIASGATSIGLNTWAHVVGIFDDNGNTLRVYVNGVQDGELTSVTGNPQSNTDPLNIGSNQDQLGKTINGLIDDVRVYNRALSAGEVAALYNVGAAKYTPPNNLGLVGYWSFNEGTSTVALDYSGNKNKGTLTNGPAWVNGKQGKALSFDGVNDYVQVANPTILQNQNITVSFWVKPGTQDNAIVAPIDFSHNWRVSPLAYGSWVIQSEDATTNRNYYFAFNQGSGATSVYENNGAGAGIQYTTGVWQHIVYTKSGTTQRGYKDGALVWSPAVTTSSSVYYKSGLGLRVGGVVAYEGTREFNGQLDEVRVYNRALTPSEIKVLYNVGAAKFAPPNNQGLVGYWSFNEGTSTIALDYSGNKNKGTLVNGPTWADGKQGKALNFDGGNDYVDVPDTPSISLTGNFALSVWIKTTSNSVQQGIIEKYTTTPPSISGYLIRIRSDGKLQAFSVNSAGTLGSATSNTVITTNVWHYVAAVYDGATMKIYLDGVQDVSASDTINPDDGSGTLKIGARGDDALTPFSGSIDDVRVYNRALPADEIQKLYNAGR